MNAVEFVKKFGIDKAKDLACRDKTSIGCLSIEHHNLNQEELKQIVDAFKLVEFIGGDLDGAKLVYEFTKSSINISLKDGVVSVLDLKKSINLVEQCNA